MSNYCEIIFVEEVKAKAKTEFKSVKQGLLFGTVALEEFNRLMFDQLSQNATMQSFNVLYCGAYNFNMVNRTKAPSYAEFIEKLEDWYETEQAPKQLSEILDVWNESRFGKGLNKQTESIKKKAEELNQNLSTSSR